MEKNQGEGRRTFRGETWEAALETARAEMGPNVRVISANRLRRGGVFGFFATEIGYEVVVEEGSRPSGVPEILESMIRRTKDAAEVNTTAVRAVVERETANRTSASTAGNEVVGTASRIPGGVRLLDGASPQAEDQRQRDRENAAVLIKRIEERQNELLEDRVRERERAAQIAAERDAERHRAARLEVERERLAEEITETRERAAEELGRLAVEKEEAERREHALRVEISRLHGERDSLKRRHEVLREVDVRPVETVPAAASDVQSTGVEVLGKLSLPENVLSKVRSGTPIAKAIDSSGAASSITDQSGLVVLVGPGQLVLERQLDLSAKWGVPASECAYVTVRDLVQRETVGVRVLRDEADIVSWVDGRRDPRKTAILAVEYNATPSWAGALRRVSRAVPYGKWRLVLPATYPLGEVRTLLTALVLHEPKIDLVGVRRTTDSARMLQFAEHIATVDGETHSGDLWASLLWERACQI